MNLFYLSTLCSVLALSQGYATMSSSSNTSKTLNTTGLSQLKSLGNDIQNNAETIEIVGGEAIAGTGLMALGAMKLKKKFSQSSKDGKSKPNTQKVEKSLPKVPMENKIEPVFPTTLPAPLTEAEVEKLSKKAAKPLPKVPMENKIEPVFPTTLPAPLTEADLKRLSENEGTKTQISQVSAENKNEPVFPTTLPESSLKLEIPKAPPLPPRNKPLSSESSLKAEIPQAPPPLPPRNKTIVEKEENALSSSTSSSENTLKPTPKPIEGKGNNRSDLLNEIRNGKKLKSVDPIPETGPKEESNAFIKITNSAFEKMKAKSMMKNNSEPEDNESWDDPEPVTSSKETIPVKAESKGLSTHISHVEDTQKALPSSKTLKNDSSEHVKTATKSNSTVDGNFMEKSLAARRKALMGEEYEKENKQPNTSKREERMNRPTVVHEAHGKRIE